MNRLTYKLDEPIKTKYLNYEYKRIPDYDIDRGNYGRISDDMIFNKIVRRSNAIQFDEMGYPLRLCIFKCECGATTQRWVDAGDRYEMKEKIGRFAGTGRDGAKMHQSDISNYYN